MRSGRLKDEMTYHRNNPSANTILDNTSFLSLEKCDLKSEETEEESA
jgi:hypothetical protein